jgi:uncharacterized protein (DUF1697 family)
MPRFAALLRGINVGPTTKVPMPELRAFTENELGYTDVKTLLNSGNLIFTGHVSPKAVDAQLADAFSERFGFRIEVVCRTTGQLESVLKHDPFGKVANDDSKLLVLFMSKQPKKNAALKEVLDADYGKELCDLRSREFFIWSPNGVSESKSWPALAKSKTVDHVTGRNIRTIKKIVDAM